MKVYKAPGTDGIPSEFHKYSHGIFDKPLTVLFNHVLNTRSYPNTWCEALINPLHKQESPTLPDNNRKMTIAPAIGTVFDGILNNRLQFAKECLSLGDPLQNGFKPNANAIGNVFFTERNHWQMQSQWPPLVYMFCWFKSAFDLINRPALLFNLINQGCVEIFYLWFKVCSGMPHHCELGWSSWGNIWKYARSSAGWSIRSESFKIIPWRHHWLSRYKKRCTYRWHENSLSPLPTILSLCQRVRQVYIIWHGDWKASVHSGTW